MIDDVVLNESAIIERCLGRVREEYGDGIGLDTDVDHVHRVPPALHRLDRDGLAETKRRADPYRGSNANQRRGFSRSSTSRSALVQPSARSIRVTVVGTCARPGASARP